MAARADLEPGAPLPVPPGHARTPRRATRGLRRRAPSTGSACSPRSCARSRPTRPASSCGSGRTRASRAGGCGRCCDGCDARRPRREPMRVLFVSDTHLGFDLPARPRVDRRRRGPDFFACFERALEPALRGEADVVVHGGDLLYRSRVPRLARRSARCGRSCAWPRPASTCSSSRATTSARRSPTRCSRRTRGSTCSAGRRRSCRRPTRPARGLRRLSLRARRAPRVPGAARGHGLPRGRRRTRACCASTTASRAPSAALPPASPSATATTWCGRTTCRTTWPSCSAATSTGTRSCATTSAGRPLRGAGRLRGLRRAHVLRGARRDQGLRDGFGRRRRPRRPAPGLRVPAAPRAPDARARGDAGVRSPRVWNAGSATRLGAAPPDVVLQVRVPEALAGADVLRAARLRALAPPTANVTVSVRGSSARFDVA